MKNPEKKQRKKDRHVMVFGVSPKELNTSENGYEILYKMCCKKLNFTFSLMYFFKIF